MKMTHAPIALTLALALALMSGCGQPTPDAPAAVKPAEPAMSMYDAAVANDARSEEDRGRDAGRRPAEVLEALGIESGMRVLDLFSGGGWYAEIIAYTVGDSGHVIAHSNEAYKNFVGEALAERFDGSRVANVEIMMAENNELMLEENSLDAVTMMLSYHDVYHVDVENKWNPIDGPAFLAEIKKGLKAGGIVAIVDHRAAPGAAQETGETLHRIDPDLVIANMQAAGFVLDGQSDLLSNPDDDLSAIVFAPDIRGKTSRFILRFKDPE